MDLPPATLALSLSPSLASSIFSASLTRPCCLRVRNAPPDARHEISWTLCHRRRTAADAVTTRRDEVLPCATPLTAVAATLRAARSSEPRAGRRDALGCAHASHVGGSSARRRRRLLGCELGSLYRAAGAHRAARHYLMSEMGECVSPARPAGKMSLSLSAGGRNSKSPPEARRAL